MSVLSRMESLRRHLIAIAAHSVMEYSSHTHLKENTALKHPAGVQMDGGTEARFTAILPVSAMTNAEMRMRRWPRPPETNCRCAC